MNVVDDPPSSHIMVQSGLVRRGVAKFGDEAGDQTGGLIESCTRLKLSIGLFLSD